MLASMAWETGAIWILSGGHYTPTEIPFPRLCMRNVIVKMKTGSFETFSSRRAKWYFIVDQLGMAVSNSNPSFAMNDQALTSKSRWSSNDLDAFDKPPSKP